MRLVGLKGKEGPNYVVGQIVRLKVEKSVKMKF